ncbi:hypothetical protein Y032_0075g936 [Ancylostoma ceylanicum]|uniref:Uncharacterized protein n=1 Tax=Ancylostoma ceylanicum TaxID=53326 RepID=A0A016TV58_9BILA|nr:hypothetical protein Y032_0075g936 [Ancylostoma ceylanicum]
MVEDTCLHALNPAPYISLLCAQTHKFSMLYFSVMYRSTIIGSSYQSPSFASSSRSPFLLPSNLSSYDVPKKKSSYAFESEHAEEIPHSRSWAGPSQSRSRANQSSPSAYAFAIHPTQSDASTSQSSSRKSRTPLLTPSSSYDNQRRSRVSQV